MTLTHEQLMIVINWIVCFSGIVVSVCRLGQMQGDVTKLSVRIIYTIYVVMFATSASSYWYGEIPGRAQIGMGILLLSVLMVSFGAWRFGPPVHTFKPSAIWANIRATATGQHSVLVERRHAE